jgi:uncharacterized protein
MCFQRAEKKSHGSAGQVRWTLGHLCFSNDVYSLGVSNLYEILYGGYVVIEGRVLCQTRPNVILPRVRKTASLFDRAKWLLGYKHLEQGESLLLDPCSSIHTIFMLFPIDVIFLNKSDMITKIIHTMKPFRFAMALRSSSVLELMAGLAYKSGIQPGDHLIWEETV